MNDEYVKCLWHNDSNKSILLFHSTFVLYTFLIFFLISLFGLFWMRFLSLHSHNERNNILYLKNLMNSSFSLFIQKKILSSSLYSSCAHKTIKNILLGSTFLHIWKCREKKNCVHFNNSVVEFICVESVFRKWD